MSNKIPSWKQLDEFAKVGGVEKLLLVTSSDWRTIVFSSVTKWEQCAILIRVTQRLASLRTYFPVLIGQILTTLESEGDFARMLDEQLQSLCNSGSVLSQSNLKASLSDVMELLHCLNIDGVRRIRMCAAIRELLARIGASDEIKSRLEYIFSSSCGENHKDATVPSPYEMLLESPDIKSVMLKKSYSTVENYLSTQRLLLAEDFFLPLRQYLEHFKKGCCSTAAGSDTYSYGKVTVKECISSPRVCLKLQLTRQEFDYEGIDWESSKRLLMGSLLILVDKSNLVLVTVESREDLKRGIVVVSRPLKHQFSLEHQYYLIEAKAYWESYRYVLATLQLRRSIPLESHLVFGTRPDNKQSFDADKHLSDFLAGPNGVQNLNESQLAALKTVLTQELCLIQGPPGTGKSYLGKWCVSLLLHNKWRDGPVVIVCYTNRALDSFLEALLAITEKIVRVGGRSSSPMLEKYMLQFLRHKMREERKREQNFFKKEKELEQILWTKRQEIDRVTKIINSGKGDHVMKPADFRQAGVSCLEGYSWRPGEFSAWLSGDEDNCSTTEASSPWNMSHSQRRQKYQTLCQSLWSVLDNLQSESELAMKQLSELQAMEAINILSGADIVGMTTTGAAKHHGLLSQIGARVMVMEEAGQILEAHSIASIPSTCQQLILIGDHQQLRPTVASYKLAKTHNLGISLFERLILGEFPYTRLLEQHRMRPEISRLVASVFYPGLRDHCSVLSSPNVNGMCSNMCFINHSLPETAEQDGGGSKTNLFEAMYLLYLAKYLSSEGWKLRDISILTTYVGQWLLITKLVNAKFPELEGIEIAVVDNYQGEENKIILLSLVRSGNSIGFLSESSRACVALSRAKWGLYIVGNGEALAAKSAVWKSVKTVLEQTGQFTDSLLLRCPRHNASTVTVKDLQDFERLQEKRCNLPCATVLRCGHTCCEPCHSEDQNHSARFSCQVMEVLRYECGHSSRTLCSSLGSPRRCQEIVSAILTCGHKQEKRCSEVTNACNELCLQRLNCGHECRLRCHGLDDRHNEKCFESCTRQALNCRATNTHTCQSACFEVCQDCQVMVKSLLPCGHDHILLPCSVDPASHECMEKCGKTLECGHLCKEFCYECKDGCRQSVCGAGRSWRELRCGHRANLRCAELEGFACSEPCTRKRSSCDHPCPLQCSEKCGECLIKVDRGGILANCGHAILAACGGIESAQTSCEAVCGKKLPCGHDCSSTCASCFGGLLHTPCFANCSRMLLCGHQCQDICGVPCPPCKMRCLVFSCEHQQQCRAKCDDDTCSPCKEKCQRVCTHTKCTKKCVTNDGHVSCTAPCPKPLSCGHVCVGYCSENCPEECWKCNDLKNSERLIRLPCGDSVPESELAQASASKIIGVLTCPLCHKVVTSSHRYRREIAERRKFVVQVSYQIFALKLKLPTLKKELLADAGGLGNIQLRALVNARCADTKNLLTLQEAAVLGIKVRLMGHLQSHDDLTFIRQSLMEVSTFGTQYLADILKLLSLHNRPLPEGTSAGFLVYCFSAGSWSLCDTCKDRHVYFSVFAEKCPKCI